MTEVDEESSPPHWLNRLAGFIDMDSATKSALLSRVWQFSGGFVSVLLISRCLDDSVQGFYYTFGSLIELTVFVELGLSVVTVHVTSHEWAKLNLNEQGGLVGDPDAMSRLVSMGRFLLRWYGFAAALFLILVGPGGYLFLSKEVVDFSWRPQWIIACLVSGLQILLVPFQAILRGCNQVSQLHRKILLSNITTSLTVWATLLLGLNLWVLVAANIVQLLWNIWFVLIRYGEFFRSFQQPVSGPVIDYRKELLPLQWRLAAQAITGYFAFSLFTPVMFEYEGAVRAGQMGMAWTVITAMQRTGTIWLNVKAPQFGVFVATRQFEALDAMYRRVTLISTLCVAMLGSGIYLGILMLQLLEFPFASRVLPADTVLILILATLVYHLPRCQDVYIRAHKIDPMAGFCLLAHCLIGLGVWYGGMEYGAKGAAGSYLLVATFVVVPGYQRAMRVCRRTQRRADDSPTTVAG